MTWLLRLLLGGLGWLRDIARAVLRWLLSDWRHPPLVGLAVCTAAYMFLINPRLHADLAEAKAALAAEIEAHNGTIADFWAASKLAEARQRENVARVAGEQAAITERIGHEYQDKLAALRSRHAALAGAVPRGVRTGAPEVDPGAPGAAGLPGPGAAATGAGEAAGDHGLSLGQRLIASEQALQLDALIDWVLAQAAVNTSPQMAPAPEPAP